MYILAMIYDILDNTKQVAPTYYQGVWGREVEPECTKITS